MFSSSMLHFLSKDGINAHIEYMLNIKRKYSIIEKSYPELYGRNILEQGNIRLPRDIYTEAANLMRDYIAHKIYFDSFADNLKLCPEIKKYYSSENAFCYEIVEKAKKIGECFLFVTVGRSGEPKILSSEEYRGQFSKKHIILSLDLCEHAYFLDYRFDRDRYIRSAASRLDIQKLFRNDKKDLT